MEEDEYLEVGEGLRVGAAAAGLVQQVTEHVEQEEDTHQVQKREETLESRNNYLFYIFETINDN